MRMEAAGEWVAFLVLEQQDEGCPAKKWRAERHGLCSLGRRVLRVQGLSGLQADGAPAVMQQVMVLKTNVCLVFPLVHLILPEPT